MNETLSMLATMGGGLTTAIAAVWALLNRMQRMCDRVTTHHDDAIDQLRKEAKCIHDDARAAALEQKAALTMLGDKLERLETRVFEHMNSTTGEIASLKADVRNVKDNIISLTDRQNRASSEVAKLRGGYGPT